MPPAASGRALDALIAERDPVLPRRRAARAQRADRRAGARICATREQPPLSRLRGGPHDLPRARAGVARGRDRRRRTRLQRVRSELRGADRRVDATRGEGRRDREHDPADDGAGAGALSRGAAHRRRRARSAALRRRVGDLRARQRRRPGRGAVPRIAPSCRPIARTTSRRWRTRRSPSRRRTSAGG